MSLHQVKVIKGRRYQECLLTKLKLKGRRYQECLLTKSEKGRIDVSSSPSWRRREGGIKNVPSPTSCL